MGNPGRVGMLGGLGGLGRVGKGGKWGEIGGKEVKLGEMGEMGCLFIQNADCACGAAGLGDRHRVCEEGRVGVCLECRQDSR